MKNIVFILLTFAFVFCKGQVVTSNDSACNAELLNVTLSGVLSYELEEVILPTGVNPYLANAKVGKRTASGKFLQGDSYAIIDQSYEVKEVRYVLSGIDVHSDSYKDTVSVYIKPKISTNAILSTSTFSGQPINFDVSQSQFVPDSARFYWVPDYLVEGGIAPLTIKEAKRSATFPNSLPVIKDTVYSSTFSFVRYYMWSEYNGCIYTPTSAAVDTFGDISQLYVVVFPSGGSSRIAAPKIGETGIYDMNGRKVSAYSKEAFARMPSGLYIINDGERLFKKVK